MADALNYQPSHSAVYYTEPRRVDIARTIGASAVASLIAIAGGWTYSHFEPNLDSIFMRGGAVCVAAIATGVIGWFVVKFGRVRIPLLATLLGACLGLLVLYVMWLVWVKGAMTRFGIQVDYPRLIRHPVSLYRVIQLISHVGIFSYQGHQVYGPPLVFFWIGEAALIMSAAVLLPFKAIEDDEPVCLECGEKCRSIGPLPRFDGDQQSQLVGVIQSRSFSDLSSFAPPGHEDDPELTLRLMCCPKCHATNVLTMSHVAWYRDRHRLVVKRKPIINRLLITADEAEEIKEQKVKIEAQRAESESDPSEGSDTQDPSASTTEEP